MRVLERAGGEEGVVDVVFGEQDTRLGWAGSSRVLLLGGCDGDHVRTADAGSVMRTVVPVGVPGGGPSRTIVPPTDSTIRLQIGSPMPVPGMSVRASRRSKTSKAFCR